MKINKHAVFNARLHFDAILSQKKMSLFTRFFSPHLFIAVCEATAPHQFSFFFCGAPTGQKEESKKEKEHNENSAKGLQQWGSGCNSSCLIQAIMTSTSPLAHSKTSWWLQGALIRDNYQLIKIMIIEVVDCLGSRLYSFPKLSCTSLFVLFIRLTINFNSYAVRHKY